MGSSEQGLNLITLYYDLVNYKMRNLLVYETNLLNFTEKFQIKIGFKYINWPKYWRVSL